MEAGALLIKTRDYTKLPEDGAVLPSSRKGTRLGISECGKWRLLAPGIQAFGQIFDPMDREGLLAICVYDQLWADHDWIIQSQKRIEGMQTATVIELEVMERELHVMYPAASEHEGWIYERIIFPERGNVQQIADAIASLGHAERSDNMMRTAAMIKFYLAVRNLDSIQKIRYEEHKGYEMSITGENIADEEDTGCKRED